MNLTKYRKRAGYGHQVCWSKNAVAAKARRRLADNNEQTWTNAPVPTRLKHVTISLKCGSERRSFRVSRYDQKRFIALGRVQAASSIGRRIALVLEALL